MILKIKQCLSLTNPIAYYWVSRDITFLVCQIIKLTKHQND